MGGDGIESASRAPKKKVHWLFNRFLVGIIWNSTIQGPINIIEKLGSGASFVDGTNYAAPISTDEICRQVARLLPIVARHMDYGLEMAVKAGLRSAEMANLTRQQPGKLFIIDTIGYVIHLADYGSIYPIREYEYKLHSRVRERAICNGELKPVGKITPDALNDSFVWCKNRIDDFREDVRKLKGAETASMIGDLGFCYLVTRDGVTERKIDYEEDPYNPHSAGQPASLEEFAIRMYPDPANMVSSNLMSS